MNPAEIEQKIKKLNDQFGKRFTENVGNLHRLEYRIRYYFQMKREAMRITKLLNSNKEEKIPEITEDIFDLMMNQALIGLLDLYYSKLKALFNDVGQVKLPDYVDTKVFNDIRNKCSAHFTDCKGGEEIEHWRLLSPYINELEPDFIRVSKEFHKNLVEKCNTKSCSTELIDQRHTF